MNHIANGAGDYCDLCPRNIGCSSSICFSCSCSPFNSCILNKNSFNCLSSTKKSDSSIIINTFTALTNGNVIRGRSVAGCSPDCNTCIFFLFLYECQTCIANNASNNGFLGCICNPGYYNNTALTAVNACKSCHAECTTCNQQSTCSTCKSSNATPSTPQGCTCNTGYWGAHPLTTSTSCIACYPDCATCSQALLCLACKSSNSSTNSIQGCSCNVGYFNTTALTAATSCIACYSECITCNKNLLCLTCKSSNAIPSALQGCACNAGY